MSGYLVDTNILSELTKPSPEPNVERFLRQSKTRVFMSVLSVGEIRKGIWGMATGTRGAILEDWLDNEIMPWFADRVLPVTPVIAERWVISQRSRKLKAEGVRLSIPS